MSGPASTRRGRRLRPLGIGLAAAAGLVSLAATSGVPEALPGAPAFPEPLRGRLVAALAERGVDYVPRTRNRREDGSPRYTNRLLLETSPYLQQHAHNPVNWYPWDEEAFETARRLDRPVFVSIGYSTCHWCHVMEEESFDDPRVARELNEHFVAIKVDREVRPDIDAIYMAAAQVLNGSGGWPLNVWTTPAGEPFFAGSYFPPEDRGGRRGLLGVLKVIRERYASDRTGVTTLAQRLAAAIRSDLEGRPAELMSAADPAPLHAAYRAYAEGFDAEAGGLRGSPKFPSQLPVRFLLRYHRRTGEPRALEMAVLTLERMAAGGIHDQLGGGFHRYAVDAAWQVPHFEKMLYDNALRVLEYLEAWQATGRADFAEVVRRTLEYVEREMTAPEGGFYSATDADSRTPEGELEEGRFFSWTPEEVDGALGPEVGAAARAHWGVVADGPLEGRSVLHVARSPASVAAQLGIPEPRLEERLARARDGLLAARGKRPAPLRDEKILTAWNGLMISAFARAGFALDEPRWLERAARAADFALERLRRDGRLLRVTQGERAEGPAFLDDYALVIAALLDLYEAAPDPRWLREAVALQAALDRHYADDSGGGYFQTADDHPRLLVREKPIAGGATPSGNAVAAANLLRLAELTGDAAHAERADLLFAGFEGDLRERPTAVADLLMALDRRLEPGREIVLVRPDPEPGGIDELLAPLRRHFVPNRIVVRAREGEDLAAHATLAPVAAGKRAIAGRATAYVCQNRVCRFPTSDPEVFGQQLAEPAPFE